MTNHVCWDGEVSVESWALARRLILAILTGNDDAYCYTRADLGDCLDCHRSLIRFLAEDAARLWVFNISNSPTPADVAVAVDQVQDTLAHLIDPDDDR